MCALQMQAEYGPTLVNQAAEFDHALEKFLVKQVGKGGLGMQAAGSGKSCIWLPLPPCFFAGLEMVMQQAACLPEP